MFALKVKAATNTFKTSRFYFKGNTVSGLRHTLYGPGELLQSPTNWS